jgi:hypothetical protein
MTNRPNFKQVVLGIGALVFFAGPLWAQVYSHARIVRLSFAEGTVRLERPDAAGTTEAAVNTPIQEGFKLQTSDDSFAEVEFENSSTARVGQLSELDFDQLALDSNGGKLNRMELVQGYATFNVMPEEGDVYEVKAGAAAATVPGGKLTRFRVDLDNGSVRVEVFKGSVEVTSPYGEEHLAKNAVLEIEPGAEHPVALSRGITEDAWDKWVNEREEKAQTARRRSPPGLYTNNASELLYGWNDLYYYGSWAYVPAYGYGWIPAAGYGWSPYSYGQWVWYPGFGLTWISYEPWGWVPFHYGGWIYDANFGWCWIPGGFNAWSPGLVSWYQGPGWVGWTPRPPHVRPGGRPVPRTTNCGGSQSCGTVVSAESFRAGLPVAGHRLPGISVTSAFAVERPNLQPGLPSGTALQSSGRTRTSPAVSGQGIQIISGSSSTSGASGIRSAAGVTGARAPAPARVSAGTRPAGTANQGVVFDPSEGRYVNGTQSAPTPLRIEPPSAVSEPAGTSGVRSGVASSPKPAATRSRPAFADNHHASPSTGTESRRSAPTGVFERTLNSWGAGGNSTPSSTPGNAGGWSAPSSPATNSGRFGGSSGGGGTSPSGRFGSAGPRSGGGGARPAPSPPGGRPHP